VPITRQRFASHVPSSSATMGWWGPWHNGGGFSRNIGGGYQAPQSVSDHEFRGESLVLLHRPLVAEPGQDGIVVRKPGASHAKPEVLHSPSADPRPEPEAAVHSLRLFARSGSRPCRGKVAGETRRRTALLINDTREALNTDAPGSARSALSRPTTPPAVPPLPPSSPRSSP
jgi:hypothetical protein